METERLIKNLEVPEGIVDAVLDTDAFNEADDQFAIAYMLASKERINPKAIYAAPFLNEKSVSPKDGMEKSYDEIFKVLSLIKRDDIEVFKGSENYLKDENTPTISDAAKNLTELAMNYSPEKPLYVIAIAALTNIASAILMKPEITDKIVVVWLGGHGHQYHDTKEFNMYQDIAAARVVMGSGVPFVQLPSKGIVTHFTISRPELELFLKGKNAICDYLVNKMIEDTVRYEKRPIWTRCIFDVTAVAWLLNDKNRFLKSRIINACLPAYDLTYEKSYNTPFMRYVYFVERDALMRDLIKKLTEYEM